MNKIADKKRDRTITREIHRLFWRANLQDPLNLIISYVTRMTAVAAYNIFIPLLTAYAIQAIIQNDPGGVQRNAYYILGLALLYCVCWAVGDMAVNTNGIRASKYVQRQAFSNFMSKDYAFYSNTFFGSLGAQVFRLRDAFHRYAFLTTMAIPKQIVIIGAGVLVIALQSPGLALLTLFVMLLALSYTIVSNKGRMKYRRREAEASSVVAGNVGDALTHATTVKSFATEPYEEERMQKSLDAWGVPRLRAWNSFWPADVGRMSLTAIATVVLLIFSAHAYQQGDISITIVILIQLYVLKLVASTMEIADIIKAYEEVMSAAYEPLKTMRIPVTVEDPANPQSLPKSEKNVIEFIDVSYRYDEARERRFAIKDLSLRINPGEKIGVVGYSGSGKTTLTKLLLRFMDVTKGSISINGIDIRDVKQHDLRHLISYVPQEPLLFHRTIWENINYGRPEATKEEVLAAAKAAYVDEFVDELPNGYDTLVGERGVKLSGGQRQRVAIARAILRDAPILILDEATSALDSRSERYIQKALWKLMKGRTALVIAHRLSTIQRMDRIAVMDKGKIVQLGTHEELLKDKKGIYAELWSHQSGGYVGVPESTTGQDKQEETVQTAAQQAENR
jgi:ATP-binding cassette subfamily B protein